MITVQALHGRTPIDFLTFEDFVREKIESSSDGPGQLEQLNNQVQELTCYIAWLSAKLIEQKQLNPMDVVDRFGYKLIKES